MFNHKIIFLIIFSTLILSVLALPVLALTYSPGVTVGKYVKYGNFVGTGQGFEGFNDIGFQQFQVTAVSGNQVTLLSTGQYKNGTVLPGNGTTEVWDIAAGTQNGTPDTQGPIIAANLNQGDAIPPVDTYMVNSTEQRSYLGVNRSVNLLSVTLSTSDYNTTLSYVYDKASGMLLESSLQTVTQSEPAPVISGYSYSVIETNLFNSASPSPTPGPSGNQLNEYIIIGVIIAVVVVAIGVLLMNRKRL
jgi:hypothetical protein